MARDRALSRRERAPRPIPSLLSSRIASKCNSVSLNSLLSNERRNRELKLYAKRMGERRASGEPLFFQFDADDEQSTLSHPLSFSLPGSRHPNLRRVHQQVAHAALQLEPKRAFAGFAAVVRLPRPRAPEQVREPLGRGGGAGLLCPIEERRDRGRLGLLLLLLRESELLVDAGGGRRGRLGGLRLGGGGLAARGHFRELRMLSLSKTEFRKKNEKRGKKNRRRRRALVPPKQGEAKKKEGSHFLSRAQHAPVSRFELARSRGGTITARLVARECRKNPAMQAPERDEAAPSLSMSAAAAAAVSTSAPSATKPPQRSSGRCFLMPNGQTLAAVLAANDPGAGRPSKKAYSSGVKGSGSAAHERRWRRESGKTTGAAGASAAAAALLPPTEAAPSSSSSFVEQRAVDALGRSRRRRYLNDRTLRDLAGPLPFEKIASLFAPAPFGAGKPSPLARLVAGGGGDSDADAAADGASAASAREIFQAYFLTTTPDREAAALAAWEGAVRGEREEARRERRERRLLAARAAAGGGPPGPPAPSPSSASLVAASAAAGWRAWSRVEPRMRAALRRAGGARVAELEAPVLEALPSLLLPSVPSAASSPAAGAAASAGEEAASSVLRVETPGGSYERLLVRGIAQFHGLRASKGRECGEGGEGGKEGGRGAELPSFLLLSARRKRTPLSPAPPASSSEAVAASSATSASESEGDGNGSSKGSRRRQRPPQQRQASAAAEPLVPAATCSDVVAALEVLPSPSPSPASASASCAVTVASASSSSEALKEALAAAAAARAA